VRGWVWQRLETHDLTRLCRWTHRIRLVGADVHLATPNNLLPREGSRNLNFGRLAALMDARWSDFHNLAAGCGTSLVQMSA
jgi:hypothetical protein